MWGPQTFFGIMQSVTTMIVAGIAVYVAWQQWTLSHDKVALDLYDRRLGAYKNLREALGKITQTGTAEDNDMLEFIWKANEFQFLFDQDVLDYHKEFYSNGIRLSYLRKKYSLGIKGDVAHYNNDAVVEEQTKLLTWFSEQYEPSTALYGRYLKIGRRSRMRSRRAN